ncbi:MAG: hypothetical protein J6M44_08795 [Butyrivibrio sp.]|nr:hypothetical protein [Butyrivibrio sp.]
MGTKNKDEKWYNVADLLEMPDKEFKRICGDGAWDISSEEKTTLIDKLWHYAQRSNSEFSTKDDVFNAIGNLSFDEMSYLALGLW